jgi:hypothetical protein
MGIAVLGGWVGGRESKEQDAVVAEGEVVEVTNWLPDGLEYLEQPVRRVLELEEVEQADLNYENEATLVLYFSHPVAQDQLTRHLVLRDSAGGRQVGYRMASMYWWEKDRFERRVPGSSPVKICTDSLEGAKLELELAAGLPSSAPGVEPLAEADKRTFNTSRDLSAVTASWDFEAFGDRKLHLNFPVRVEPEELESHVEIKPAVALSDVRETTLTGDFEEGTEYTVTVKAGLRAACGAVLEKDVELSGTGPEVRPGIRFADAGTSAPLLLSPRGSMRLEVDTFGLLGVEATARKVRESALAEWNGMEGEGRWQEILPYWDFPAGWFEDMGGVRRATTNWLETAVAEAEQEGKSKRKAHALWLDLNELAGEGAKGLYMLEVRGIRGKIEGGERKVEGSVGRWRTVLNITDTALHAQVRKDREALVAATSLRTGRPMAGVEVTAWGRGRAPLATGQTGADGLAHLKWDGETAEAHGRLLMLTGKTEGDLAVLRPDWESWEEDGEAMEAGFLDEGQHEAYAWTDRGIYRHGETVRFQALLRDRAGRAPEAYPLELRAVEMDRGELKFKKTLMPDETGAVDCEVTVGEEWRDGTYALTLVPPGEEFGPVVGRTFIKVADFVPPQVRVDVEGVAREAGPGEVAAEVRAEYLFGREAANLPYTPTWSFRAAPFQPKGWNGWTFGDATKKFPSRDQKRGESRLDGAGKGRASFDVPKSWQPPARIEASCSVTVREEGGRAARGWTKMAVDVYPRYVGLKGSWGDGEATAGEEQRVEIVQLRPDGSGDGEAPPLHVALYRTTWASALRRNPDGTWEWGDSMRRVLVEEATVGGGDGVKEWTFTPERAGGYLVVARDPASGVSASLPFDAARAGEALEARPGGDLELAWANKRAAAPGEEARLRVKSPFAGYAVVSVFDQELRWASAMDIPAGGTTLKVPVPADTELATLTVRVNVSRAVGPEKVWSAHRLTKHIALPVARPERALKVSLRAPKTAKPQEPLKVRLSAAGADGAPAAGVECSVAAVDEAVCLLSAFESPDPEAWLRRARRGELLFADDFGRLMRESEEAALAAAAPGGDGAGFLRSRLNPIKARRYKPTALWSGVVKTDEKGVAEITFDVPQFTGELRLMAVAWDARRTGASAKAVKVRRDLVVRPSFPRFLGCGDTARVAVPVHNEGKEPTRAVARMTCFGEARVETGEQVVELAPGEGRTLWFDVRAGEKAGLATFHLEVEDGKDLHREDVEMAVRPEGGVQTRYEWAVVAPGAVARMAAPEGWVAESVGADLTASAMPSLEAAAALDYVATYPHGCLEQTISGVLAFVPNGDWARRLRNGTRLAGDPEARMKAAIARVWSMQRADGGFGMWPWSPEGTDVAGSFYAVQFLLEARKAGYEVDEGRLARALRWLDERWNAAVAESDARRRWERANIAWLKAMAGDAPDSWLNALEEESGRMDAPSRVLLASAMLLAGEPARGVALLEGIDPAAALDGEEWCGVLETPVRYAALLLDAWLDVDADAPQVAALMGALRRLRGKEPHWGTTQANAMALQALGKAARHLPAKEGPFSLAIEAGGKRERTDAVLEVGRAWGPGAGAGGVAVSNAGPNVATVVVRFEGVDAEPEPPKAQGCEIERLFRNLQGEIVDASTLRQGELVVVELVVRSEVARRDLVVEDLLPAGWEIENPNLLNSETSSWQPAPATRGRELHREMRDDRLILFTGRVEGEAHYAYLARAVTPGEYRLPGTVVEGMYRPDVRAVGEGGSVRVVE